MKKPIPFGKYYLLERVNVGGMAEVFKAKAFGVEGFERLLAVKRILPNIAEDKEFIEMFIDEAKIAVQLSHANVAQIFDLGKVDDSFFIALEFVHGKDLRAIFDRCRGMGQIMPIAQACFVIMKVCEGLDYAHNKRDAAGNELNLVHRDVSPQNILVSYEGEIKLIDFGIAKAAGKASKTQAGILKGKFGYMSPEQVRGLPIDRRSDIFAVGIVLYELLTGERLFMGESDFSTLEKVRNVEILPPSTYNRKIPDELERIVLKTLTKDVDDRYLNAIDLHDDLQAFMYTAGEFYSRKDLAAWMKKTFAAEIEEETRKLEEYRSISPPDPSARSVAQPGRPASRPVTAPPPPPPEALALRQPTAPPRATLLGLGTPTPTPATPSSMPSMMVSAAGGAPSPAVETEWDEEELETQIYDKPDGAAAAPTNGEISGEVAIEEDAPPRIPTDLLPDPRFGTLPPGFQAVPPGATVPGERPFPLPGIDAPLETPKQGVPAYPPSQTTTGFGARVAPAAAPRPRGVGLYAAIVGGVFILCVAVVGAYYYLTHRPGTILVTSFPSDVQVLIDQEMVAKETPKEIEKPPGSYQVTVQRDGYEPDHKIVEVRAGQRSELRAELVPLTADIGFVLKTQPQGQKAYLDGQVLAGVTPLRVSRIPPGKHTVEVRAGGCYAPWSQEFLAEAGKPAITLDAQLRPTFVQARIQSDPPRARAYLLESGKRTFVGETPTQVKLMPDKKYGVELAHGGYKATRQDIRFDGSCDLTVDATLDRVGGGGDVGLSLDGPKIKEPRPRPDRAERVDRQERPAPVAPSPRQREGREDGAPAPRERSEPGPGGPGPALPSAAKEKPNGKAVGFLQVGSKPWTKITIDGEDHGNTPNPHIVLPAGKHKLTLTNPQFGIAETRTVEIAPNDTTKVIKNFQVDDKPGTE